VFHGEIVVSLYQARVLTFGNYNVIPDRFHTYPTFLWMSRRMRSEESLVKSFIKCDNWMR
ncbi:MAG: hypothetical protein WAM00_07220, partial [Salegentibacter sp.]